MGIKPRHNLTKPRSWMGLFLRLGGYWVVIAVLVAWGAWSLSQSSDEAARVFETDGLPTTAIVLSTRDSILHNGVNDYYVTFEYYVDGDRFESERRIDIIEYSQFNTGDEVPIRYLPDAPERFEYFYGENADNSVWYAIVAFVSVMTAFFVLWLYGKPALQAIHVRRQGQRTTAEISGFVETEEAGSVLPGTGYMTWTLSDGAEGQSLERDIDELRALEVGTKIIVYVKDGISWWEGDVGPRRQP